MFTPPAPLTRTLATLAALALSAGVAHAQSTITLFGKSYNVQRFDYSAQVLLPNVAFPSDPPIPLFESEGVHWLGNNRLVMSADDIADTAPGNPDNWYVEVRLLTSGTQITGLTYSRTIARIDTVADGYDPNPGGVTVNTSATGLGAGGNLIVCGNAGRLYAHSLQTATLGNLIEFPAGSGCLSTPGACNLDISSLNSNAEDMAFVPGAGQRSDAFFIINQDLAGLDAAGVERWSTTSPPTRQGFFLVGGAVNPALTGGVAKGIVYIPDSPALPASIRRPDGVILVTFDRAFPAIQAFDVSGNLLATEFLSTTGTAFPAAPPAPPWRLDTSGCSLRPHIESIAADPATGRIFLVNQGQLLSCNFMWILTPACPVDFNGDGQRTPADIFAFLNAYFAGDAGTDFNADGQRTPADIFAFLNAYFVGC